MDWIYIQMQGDGISIIEETAVKMLRKNKPLLERLVLCCLNWI